MEWLTTLSVVFVNTITLLIMLVGLFGMIIPIFPGGVIIGLAAALYGLLIGGFSGSSLFYFIVIVILAIAGALADNVIMGSKAHAAGGSGRSILIAILSSVVVSMFLTPLAGILAAPIGLFAAEYYRTQDREASLNVTKALMLGFGWAFVVRFGLGIVQIVLWGFWAASV